jgi:hypothetical protein
MAKPKNPNKMNREELAAELERADKAAKKARSRFNLVLRLKRKADSEKK